MQQTFNCSEETVQKKEMAQAQIHVDPRIESLRYDLNIKVNDNKYPDQPDRFIKTLFVKEYKDVTLVEAWKISNAYIQEFKRDEGPLLPLNRTRFVDCTWHAERILAYDLQKSLHGDDEALHESRRETIVYYFITAPEAYSLISQLESKIVNQRFWGNRQEEKGDDSKELHPYDYQKNIIRKDMKKLLLQNQSRRRTEGQKLLREFFVGENGDWNPNRADHQALEMPEGYPIWISPIRQAINELLEDYVNCACKEASLYSLITLGQKYSIQTEAEVRALANEHSLEIFDGIYEGVMRAAKQIEAEIYRALTNATHGKYAPKI